VRELAAALMELVIVGVNTCCLSHDEIVGVHDISRSASASGKNRLVRRWEVLQSDGFVTDVSGARQATASTTAT
jgi:hypothetical protein